MSQAAYLEERITLRRSTVLALMSAAGVSLGVVGALQWNAPWPVALCALPALWIAWRSYRKDCPAH